MFRYLCWMSKSLTAIGSVFTHQGLVLNMMFTIVHLFRSSFHEIQNAQNNHSFIICKIMASSVSIFCIRVIYITCWWRIQFYSRLMFCLHVFTGMCVHVNMKQGFISGTCYFQQVWSKHNFNLVKRNLIMQGNQGWRLNFT